MAFLDNSGDIILDAVLTDYGRKLLASGGFRISKFALGDEEINYALFNGNHPSGSAHYDLEVLQTPILEAFTNNTSLMKTRLVTLSRTDILYMPILKVNGNDTHAKLDLTVGASGGFTVLADEKTYSDNGSAVGDPPDGFLRGVPNKYSDITQHICIDQGIDSSNISIYENMDVDLLETGYSIKVDHNLLTLDAYLGEQNCNPMTLRFVDDDNIATYTITQGAQNSPILGPREPGFRSRESFNDPVTEDSAATENEVFAGPLGTVLRITPRVTTRVQQSMALFDEFGNEGTGLSYRGGTLGQSNSYKQIDTVISVTGTTTGYSIDIPVRIIKGIY